LATTNLSFDERPKVIGSQRLTGALLDRPAHLVYIPELNGRSYRLRKSVARADPALPAAAVHLGSRRCWTSPHPLR
jgi:hypothetical protein